MSYTNIAKALSAHQTWISRAAIVYESWPELAGELSDAGDFNACEFGRWLATEGKVLIEDEHFARIHALHASFHRKFSDLLEHLNSNGKTEAALSLLHEAKRCSSQLISLMMLEQNLFPMPK